VATGGPGRAREAAEALTRHRATASAAGVAAEPAPLSVTRDEMARITAQPSGKGTSCGSCSRQLAPGTLQKLKGLGLCLPDHIRHACVIPSGGGPTPEV
jgi:hypothetical protein